MNDDKGNDTPEIDFIKVQEEFEKIWSNTMKVVFGGLVLGVLLWITDEFHLFPSFTLIPKILIATAYVLFSCIFFIMVCRCPRCKESLILEVTSKPKYCPRCGVSFAGLPPS